MSGHQGLTHSTSDDQDLQVSHAWQTLHARAAQRPHLATAAQHVAVHRRKGVYPERAAHAIASCCGGHERRKEDLRASQQSVTATSVLTLILPCCAWCGVGSIVGQYAACDTGFTPGDLCCRPLLASRAAKADPQQQHADELRSKNLNVKSAGAYLGDIKASEVRTDVDQRSVCAAGSISAPCVLGWLELEHCSN